MRYKRSSLFTLTLLLSANLLVSILHSAQTNPGKRIVAVGDVHGAFDAFVQILQKAKVIDQEQKWIARNTTLIQTGDILDRGPKSRAAMDLLMKLEEQAPSQKGRVIALLGNHEVMNIIGDLRYVSTEDYASYANQQSEERREKAYQEYQEFLRRRTNTMSQTQPNFTAETKAEWDKAHPPGFFEQREAFSLEGKYGRWLRKHQAVMELDEIVFLHGGISPTVSKMKISQINTLVRDDLKRFDEYKTYLLQKDLILSFFTLEEMLVAARQEVDYLTTSEVEKEKKSYQPSDPKKHLQVLQEFLAIGSWLSVHPEGPLWFRGYAEWPDTEGEENISKLLEAYHVSHFVVGHTVQQKGSIQMRFQGEVFLIDTGMLTSFYPTGRASALEIQNGTFMAIYTDREVMLFGKDVAPAAVEN
jgi:hypothetical protein